jgi:hypothetical protein
MPADSSEVHYYYHHRGRKLFPVLMKAIVENQQRTNINFCL